MLFPLTPRACREGRRRSPRRVIPHGCEGGRRRPASGRAAIAGRWPLAAEPLIYLVSVNRTYVHPDLRAITANDRCSPRVKNNHRDVSAWPERSQALCKAPARTAGRCQ
jgi:hypothetical protein